MRRLNTGPRRHKSALWANFLRFLLRITNLVLAAVGLAMCAYAVYMYIEFRDTHFPKEEEGGGGSGGGQTAGFPWFIFAFGGAGAFTFITALTGLIGAGRNNRICLGLYTFLMFAMLFAQAALAIAYFADDSWKRKLPPDTSGEAAKMKKFIEDKLAVCKYVGVGVFLVQILSVVVACGLSSAQQRALEEEEDEEEDEVWGRRQPLLQRDVEGGGSTAQMSETSPEKSDPWSQRMREKYGLDTSQFTYDPDRARRAAQAVGRNGDESGGRWCVIM